MWNFIMPIQLYSFADKEKIYKIAADRIINDISKNENMKNAIIQQQINI